MSVLLAVVGVVVSLIVIGRLGRAQPTQTQAAEPDRRNPAVAVDSHSRLPGEPIILEPGKLFLDVTLAIEPDRISDIAALRACDAIEEGSLVEDCLVVRFWKVPSPLLQQIFPELATTSAFTACLKDEAGMLWVAGFCGNWPKIRSELLAFAETPAGSRKGSQERGEFADAHYFTENFYVYATESFDAGGLKIFLVSRSRLREQIVALISAVELQLSGGAECTVCHAAESGKNSEGS